MSVTELSLRECKIDFWLFKGKNILLIGATGVGKTQLFRDGMARLGLSFDTNVAQWSTPVVDFVGADPSTADALYFDALQNDRVAQEAAKEIISLRRWRGKPVKDSAVVWGAYTLNSPSDQEIDRDLRQKFDVTVEVPSLPLPAYFERKFGKAISDAAIRWWRDLGKDEAAEVNPRRLEAALTMWQQKGDIRDTLVPACGVYKLVAALNEATKT